VTLVDAGDPINVEASMAKLLGAIVFQRVCERCLDVLGGAGIVRGSTEAGIGPDSSAPESSARWIEAAWRHSKVTSIYGGTNEVQRNIIAQRGLGLPRG
jgi:alkylation response protein AidB-like acyl-CoA dehydrogenase